MDKAIIDAARNATVLFSEIGDKLNAAILELESECFRRFGRKCHILQWHVQSPVSTRLVVWDGNHIIVLKAQQQTLLWETSLGQRCDSISMVADLFRE